MRSADVYCAPNTGGESFGIVLVEAMAAGTAVVASDLDAFRRVLVDGTAGRLVPVDDPDALAAGLIEVLEDDARRKRYIEAATEAVQRYDWSVVAGQIMRVYETVAGAGAKVQVAGTAGRRHSRTRWPTVEADDRGLVITWIVIIALAVLFVVLLLVGAVGVPDRQPAGPAARALRPVLAGARRRTGPARGGRPRGRRRRLRRRARTGKRLAALADAAERAPRAAREAAENELSAALAMVDPASLPRALVAELADAEARVLLARRFHNDAVRDTLALRERPAVRLLRLAEPPRCQPISRSPSGRRGATREVASATGARRRASCCSTATGAVLLFCGSDPALPMARRPGAALVVHRRRRGAAGGDAGEAAARELEEETGLRVDPADMVGPVWRRDAVIDFNGVGDPQRGDVLRPPHRPIRAVRRRAAPVLERAYIHGHRWCDETMISELVARGETVYPLQLGELLTEANALADVPRRRRPAAVAIDPLMCGFNGFAAAFRLDQ